MSLYNSEQQYGIISRANHWLSALIVVGLIVVGMYMSDLDNGPEKQDLYALHKSMGVALLGLILVRFVWLKVSPNPAQLSSTRFEHILGHSVKGMLYLAMLMMPITGWLLSNAAGYDVKFFDLFTLPTLIEKNEEFKEIIEEIHEFGGLMVIGLVLLHVAGALKHHFVYKDETLLRMLGRNKKD